MTGWFSLFIFLVLAGSVLAQTPLPNSLIETNAAPQDNIKLDQVDLAQAALSPDLPLDHRRYLLYLYARLYRPQIAEALARRILANSPGDKQTMLVLASMYLERKQTEKALLWGQSMAKLYPADDQALFFLAAAHEQAGHHTEAEEIFRKIKKTKFKHKLYPYENDLAGSAASAGDWYKAMLSYQELLRHQQISDELRMKARDVLEGIYREHLPQLSIEESFIWLRPGTIYRTQAGYMQHINDSQKLFLKLGREDTDVKEAPDTLARNSHNMDGVIGWEKLFNQNWNVALWGGAFGDGGMGGAYLRHTYSTYRDFKLQLDWNLRAQDGLLLESLDGRQHRLTFQGQYYLNYKWLATVAPFGREVTVRNHSLGYGYGADWTLEHIFLHEKPEFRAGYRGSANWFSRTSHDLGLAERVAGPGITQAAGEAALDNLVVHYLNRQGLFATYSDQLLNGFIRYQGTVGVDYALELASFEYYGQIGLKVYPRKSIELRVEGGYFSSARTTDRDSDQWLLILGSRFWF